MQYTCSKSSLTRPGISLLSLLTLTAAFSACRPSIDDNLPEASASTSPRSVSAVDLQDGSVTPAKLSQAYLPLAGGSLSGSLNLNGNTISNLASPSNNSDATPKSYVDAQVSAAAVPPGTITAYGGATAPSGWLLCNGAAVSRTTYAALFSAIGTSYGTGDGSTTFNIPDLRGIFPRGTGTHGTLTKSNAGAMTGPALGSTQNDQIQTHGHQTYAGNGENGNCCGIDAISVSWVATIYGWSNGYIGNDLTTVGTNGTPRGGDETRPANLGVNYMIKH